VDRQLAPQRRSRVGEVAREAEDIDLFYRGGTGSPPVEDGHSPWLGIIFQERVGDAEGLLDHWSVLQVSAGGILRATRHADAPMSKRLTTTHCTGTHCTGGATAQAPRHRVAFLATRCGCFK